VQRVGAPTRWSRCSTFMTQSLPDAWCARAGNSGSGWIEWAHTHPTRRGAWCVCAHSRESPPRNVGQLIDMVSIDRYVWAAHAAGSFAKWRCIALLFSALSRDAMIIDSSRTSRRWPTAPVVGLTAS
jgi:hypothetical protein